MEQQNNVYLDEDPIKIPGQSFLLLSVVSPEGRQKSDQLAVKIRGVFETREEADAHAKRLMSADPSFDVFVADMYRWLVLPPPADYLEEEYANNELLNELIHGYKESQQKSKEFFERRVREDVEEGEGSGMKAVESELEKAPERTPPANSVRWADIDEENEQTS